MKPDSRKRVRVLYIVRHFVFTVVSRKYAALNNFEFVFSSRHKTTSMLKHALLLFHSSH